MRDFILITIMLVGVLFYVFNPSLDYSEGKTLLWYNNLFTGKRSFIQIL